MVEKVSEELELTGVPGLRLLGMDKLVKRYPRKN